MKISKMVAALLFGTVLALFAGSAASAQYPGPTTPTTPTTGGTTQTTVPGPEIPVITVVRGETVDVKGDGCEPGSTVTVTYDDGTVLGTFTADENGEFVTTITIPLSSTLGEHLLTATCGDLQQFLNVNVLAEQVTNNPPVSNGTLPRTGSDNTAPLVGIGAAALVLGAAFVYGARRPSNTEA